MSEINPAQLLAVVVNRAYKLSEATGHPAVRTVGNVDSYLCEVRSHRNRATWRPAHLQVAELMNAYQEIMAGQVA